MAIRTVATTSKLPMALTLAPAQRDALIMRGGAIQPEAAAAFLAERATPDALAAFEGYCQAQNISAYQQGFNYTQPGEIHSTGIVGYAAGTGVPDFGGTTFDLFAVATNVAVTRAGINIPVPPQLCNLKTPGKLPSGLAMMVQEVAVTVIVIQPPTAILEANLQAMAQNIADLQLACLPSVTPQNQTPISLGLLSIIDAGGATPPVLDTFGRVSQRVSALQYRELSPPIPWFAEDSLGGESPLGTLTTRADAAGLVLGVHISLRGPLARGLSAA